MRGGNARTIVPTTNTPTTSATVKATNLSTPHPGDKRSPSLLPWSMGYWPGTHHLWVGSFLCAQITGSQDVVQSIRLACDELYMLESLINNAAPSALVWELRLGVAPLWSHCVFAKTNCVLQLVLCTFRRARSLTCETTEHTAVLGKPRTSRTTSTPTGALRQSPPQQRLNHWCARRHSPHH